MKAILWDGRKQIKGELILSEKLIRFKMKDFSDTDLDFILPYNRIDKVNYHKIFGLDAKGVEIVSKEGKKNVFVLDDPSEVINIINLQNR